MSKGWVMGGPTGNDLCLDLGVLFIRVEEEIKDSGLFFGLLHSAQSVRRSKKALPLAAAKANVEREALRRLNVALKILDGLEAKYE